MKPITIICFIGAPGSGKTTAAEYLAEVHHKTTRVADDAIPLKRAAAAITNNPLFLSNSDDLYREAKDKRYIVLNGMSGREFMGRLGQFYEGTNPHILPIAAMQLMEQAAIVNKSLDTFIVPSCRNGQQEIYKKLESYTNLKLRRVFTIKIVRETTGQTAFDFDQVIGPADATIINNGSKEDLYRNAEKLLYGLAREYAGEG